MGFFSSPYVPVIFMALGGFGAIVGALQSIRAEKGRAEFERALREKTETIANLQGELRQTMTGGDGFCYAHLDLDPTNHSGPFMIVSESRFPLYDVQLRVVNLAETIVPKLEDLNKNLFQVGNLPPHTAYLGMRTTVPAQSEAVRWNLFFGARNGHWNEELRLRKIDGKWESAVRVTKFDPAQVVLLEKISERYPRTNGLVDWE